MSTIIGIYPDINDEGHKIELNLDYYNAIVEAGGTPVILPYIPGEPTEELLKNMDGILLTGGDDIDPILLGEEPLIGLGKVNPYRDTIEMKVARYCLINGIPTLGICKGMQIMALSCGAWLYQDIVTQRAEETVQHRQKAPKWFGWHGLHVVKNSLLWNCTSKSNVIRVNSFHHQAIRGVHAGLRVSGTSSDGLIEAIEHKEHGFYLGVQWHPERMINNKEQKQIFKSFIDAAVMYKEDKHGS